MENAFLKLISSKIKFRFYLFSKLPSAFFSGVRVKNASEQVCSVTVPYKWFSKNPFKSTYFACMAMAAEMSTGLLCMMHTYQSKPSVSLLVVALEAEYFKKATDLTTFICNDGDLIKSVITEAISTNQGKSIKVKSVGTNVAGEVVAVFYITWSFKSKITA